MMGKNRISPKPCPPPAPAAGILAAAAICLAFCPASFSRISPNGDSEDAVAPDGGHVEAIASASRRSFRTTPAQNPPDAGTEYDNRAKSLGDGDAKSWLALADFCESHLLLDRREAALKKAVAIDPENKDARRRLDQAKYDGQWLPVSQAEEKEAADNAAKGNAFYGKWMPAKSAEPLREADRKKNGWDAQVRVDGRFCVVYSAAGYETAHAVASVIDNVGEAYIAMYGKIRKLGPIKPFTVFLFNKPDAFASYFKQLANFAGEVPKGFSGNFVTTLNILFLSTDIGVSGWNSESLLRTAAHESTHAFDELMAGFQLNANPIWLVEGRAAYTEYCLVGRQPVFGAMNIGGTDARGQALEKCYKTLSLAEFLGMDRKTFMQKNLLENYAAAWSIVHFLMNGEGGKHRGAFMKFFQGCPKNSSLQDFETIVGKISDLEGPYRIYVEKVFLPAAKESVNADRRAKGLTGEWK